jgi:hypothetical protein
MTAWQRTAAWQYETALAAWQHVSGAGSMTTWQRMTTWQHNQHDSMTTWQYDSMTTYDQHMTTWQYDNMTTPSNMVWQQRQHDIWQPTTWATILICARQHDAYDDNVITCSFINNMTAWQHDNMTTWQAWNHDSRQTWQRLWHDNMTTWQHDNMNSRQHDNMTAYWLMTTWQRKRQRRQHDNMGNMGNMTTWTTWPYDNMTTCLTYVSTMTNMNQQWTTC